jgi:hypothetical protein
MVNQPPGMGAKDEASTDVGVDAREAAIARS